MCVKNWTDGMNIVAIKWQDVAEECRFTASSDPAVGLNVSCVKGEGILFIVFLWTVGIFCFSL